VIILYRVKDGNANEGGLVAFRKNLKKLSLSFDEILGFGQLEIPPSSAKLCVTKVIAWGQFRRKIDFSISAQQPSWRTRIDWAGDVGSEYVLTCCWKWELAEILRT